MSFVDPKFSGTPYGMAAITEDGKAGQLVRLVDHDKLSLNDDPTKRSYGILYKDAKAGELCTAFTDGGIYETDNFTGTINPADLLKVDALNKNLTSGVSGTDVPIAEAISVIGEILRFKLLI